MTFNISEFLAVVHSLVSNSQECIEKLRLKNEQTEDEELKALIVSAASLLTIHNTLITQMTEQNSEIIDRVNKFFEDLEKK